MFCRATALLCSYFSWLTWMTWHPWWKWSKISKRFFHGQIYVLLVLSNAVSYEECNQQKISIGWSNDLALKWDKPLHRPTWRNIKLTHECHTLKPGVKWMLLSIHWPLGDVVVIFEAVTSEKKPLSLYGLTPWAFVGRFMTTSSNGSIFRVIGPLCGEFIGPRWIPITKASDAKLLCFLWSAPE